MFVQVMPTPNGRLHLGHMSGPYLKADVMARHLRSRGVEAHVVSGADAYESHVELKASQLGCSEREVATKFHALIRRELDALHVQCDFVDPLHPEVHDEYLAFNRRTVDQLVARGLTTSVREKVEYSPSTGRYIAGCWIAGTCPQCGAESGSYFCEACGAHYKPQDLGDRKTAVSDLEPLWVESLFLKLTRRRELEARVERMGIDPEFRRILSRYFAAQGEIVRLTNPGRWGMSYGAEDRVIFTYTVGLLSFSLFCAELFKRSRGLAMSPFSPASDFVTVASFGIDNAVAYLAGVLGAAVELGDIKPFDFFATNYFYHLEGKKFSTSRDHLVCASDLIRDSGVAPDAIRYFLGKVNPEKEARNFAISEFLEVNNRTLAGELEALLARHFGQLSGGEPADAPAGLLRELEGVLQEQSAHLSLPAVCMADAARCIDTWMDVGRRAGAPEAAHSYWWLKGLALVAYPFMPVVAERIWGHLGHEGAPTYATFLARPRTRPPQAWAPQFAEVSAAALERSVHREGAALPKGEVRK
ncbi:hypothetical protein BE20_36905 [Sorangium cellulosum]|uniref:Methionyl/Leucyl tRNA synthetase domain-containing protein n=1 Tax=Sorangium cellulosum TaxID=56 RepID=A0A150SZM4_SORCE|nr:hypothetical protein BE18_04645 [Sorangium cellulosum]KYF97891.1 hypothetical protein BE20_36905 [Sorangium cellulosum]